MSMLDSIADKTLNHLPPPRLVGLPIRALPPTLTQAWLARALNHHLGKLIDESEQALLTGKCVAVEVTDLSVKLSLTFTQDGLRGAQRDQAADATIRGRAADLMVLAGQIEDPDSLFFDRRLQVVGDTATGLLVRNLLDRIETGRLPLGVRILLNRGGRLGARLNARRRGAEIRPAR